MRNGTIVLDDYDQKIEVARQAGKRLFMIRIDHLLTDDYASNGRPYMIHLLMEHTGEDDFVDIDRIYFPRQPSLLKRHKTQLLQEMR